MRGKGRRGKRGGGLGVHHHLHHHLGSKKSKRKEKMQIRLCACVDTLADQCFSVLLTYTGMFDKNVFKIF